MSTNPTANCQPQSQAYAATEISMLAANVKTLSLSRITPHLASAAPTATIGPVMRFQIGVGAASGRVGGSPYAGTDDGTDEGAVMGAGGGGGSSVPMPSTS